MRLLPLAALIAVASPVAAQAQAPAQPDGYAERFLQSLKNGKVEEGLKAYAGGSQLFTRKLESDPSIAAQIKFGLTSYGPILSWERIDSETLGTTARRDTYLVQHRDMVTRWRFIYMRIGTGWIATSFVYEDQAPTWFK